MIDENKAVSDLCLRDDSTAKLFGSHATEHK